jgi:hypothetical protein
MKTISLENAKKLQELGVDRDSYFYHHVYGFRVNGNHGEKLIT